MAATRENVLAAIVEYVENNKRRAPALAISQMVSDNIVNVKAIVKSLVEDGTIESSRGRNGGALPSGVTLEKAAKPAKAATAGDVEAPAADEDTDVAAQFAALISKIEADEAQSEAAVG